MSPKRILLIGASKHIGFHVVEYLAPQPDKYALFVLARSAASSIANFKGKENVTFIQGDAKDEKTISDAINSTMNGNVDFVIASVGILPKN
jgi:NAD(P)-dependent dehydrogenase (short-subunit alcohol dehydrogenase family)